MESFWAFNITAYIIIVRKELHKFHDEVAVYENSYKQNNLK